MAAHIFCRIHCGCAANECTRVCGHECAEHVLAAQGLDIGPQSLEAFQAALVDARTILWNGPMGVFEWPRFAAGTIGIAHALAELTDKVGCLCPCIGRSQGERQNVLLVWQSAFHAKVCTVRVLPSCAEDVCSDRVRLAESHLFWQ